MLHDGKKYVVSLKLIFFSHTESLFPCSCNQNFQTSHQITFVVPWEQHHHRHKHSTSCMFYSIQGLLAFPIGHSSIGTSRKNTGLFSDQSHLSYSNCLQHVYNKWRTLSLNDKGLSKAVACRYICDIYGVVCFIKIQNRL